MLQSSLWCQHKKSSRTDHKPKIFVTHKRKELYEQTQQIPQLVFRQNRLRAGCSSVIVRNLRRDANDAVKKAEKVKEITEDEAKKGTDDIQKMTDKIIKESDNIMANKEKEVMEI